jgi:hypothetical protein
LRRRPVGQVWLPVVDDQVDLAALADDGWHHIGANAWQPIVQAALDVDERAATGASSEATVAVCTRDRPASVERCLEALSRLEAEGHELLVIDNCPSDDQTERIGARFANVRYVREPLPGLNRARNRALREARGSIVAFCRR